MRKKSATVEPTKSQVQGWATVLYIAELYGVEYVRRIAGAPPASQRRSSGAQACANAAMSFMWIESDPFENFV
jgi:hypothetical protein